MLNPSLKKVISVILIFLFFVFIYIFLDEVGIFFLENILLIDVGAVLLAGKATTKSIVAKKTFLSIVKKIGYKKLFFSVSWVIFKRYVIESITNYFKKHSFERFKNNFIEVVKLKINQMKNTSLSKKLISLFSFITGSGVAYYVFTKFLSNIIVGFLQKLFYVGVLFLWKFFSLILAVVFFVFTSILQIFFLVKIINYIEKFWIVQAFYSLVNFVFKKTLSFFDFFLGTKLHLSLIKLSTNIDEYFASILDKNYTLYETIQRKRDRYINGFELISIQREKYKKKKENQNRSILKQYDKKIRKYIKKEVTWREKREKFYKKQALRREKTKRKSNKKRIRKSKLILPNKKTN